MSEDSNDTDSNDTDSESASGRFPSIGRRSILSMTAGGAIGAVAMNTVNSSADGQNGGNGGNGSSFASQGHSHDGGELGVDERVESIAVNELDATAITNDTLTGGSRLESLVSGNLGIDSNGVLNASGLNGEVEVDGHAGSEEVQSAIEDAEADGNHTVNVLGSGEVEWRTTLQLPNNMTLDVSNTLSVVVPEDHELTRYRLGTDEIITLIMNRERSRINGAENVTIRGGQYDLSNTTEETSYAGIWLHRCTNGLIDDVVCSGAGAPIYDLRGSSRSFNLLFTACEDSEMRDSAGHDAAYDNIGIRGPNSHCRIVRCGGTGGSSGTIQSAAWGNWGLTDTSNDILYKDCWGRRIYDHGGTNITFDGCQNSYRIQTLGSDNVTVRNTTDYRGRVLLYTYQQDMSNLKVENMSFSADSDQRDAITVGLYAGDLTNVSISNVEARRPIFLQVDSYEQTGNSIDWIEVNNCRQYVPITADDSSFITQVDDLLVPDVLRVSNSVCHDADAGIEGSYGTVRVRNCAFRDVEGPAVNVDADDVETTMIDEITTESNE